MENPITKQAQREAEDNIYYEVQRLVEGQVTGSFDAIRATRAWQKYLEKWMAISPEKTAQALAIVLDRRDCLSHKQLMKLLTNHHQKL